MYYICPCLKLQLFIHSIYKYKINRKAFKNHISFIPVELSNEVNAERAKKKKPQNIIEDTRISAEMAASLDMTCVQAKITAPDIRHGFVQKYDRRRKGEHVFLVALYACNDNFELEDAEITTLYCSQRKWVGDLPNCVALGEYTDADEEGECGRNFMTKQLLLVRFFHPHRI